MADELKRVGLVFKADGAADFQKTMQQVNTAVQENSNSFKLAKAAWDDSTTAVEKLKDRQEYLAKQTDVYSDKVEILKRELEEMKSAENRNEDAIRKKQNQLTSAQISLTKYQKGLAEVTEELESGAAESKEQIRKLSDKIAESTDKIKANEIEIEALKSKYDDHIKSIVKYKDEQKYLSNQTENYERILESLKKQLDILKSAENKDEKAIQDKKNEINETTTTAELADTVAPLITKITELVAGLIEEFNQLSPEGQRLIAGCVLVVAAVGPVFSIISKVAGGVSSLIGIISKIAPVLGPIKTGFAAVNAVMAANPILIIIAAVAALIAIFVTLYNKCEWFRDGVNAIFGAVADFIKGAIDKIKGFFDFDWKLPKIKLPHFKASGEWSLSPLKVPKISVDWYANGGILNSPTIFGANGDSLMGGGEAGKEAVLPIKLLKDYIREENDANNATLAAMIVEAFKSISMTAENNIYIGDKKSITLLTNLVLKQMANKTLATQGAKGK